MSALLQAKELQIAIIKGFSFRKYTTDSNNVIVMLTLLTCVNLQNLRSNFCAKKCYEKQENVDSSLFSVV